LPPPPEPPASALLATAPAWFQPGRGAPPLVLDALPAEGLLAWAAARWPAGADHLWLLLPPALADAAHDTPWDDAADARLRPSHEAVLDGGWQALLFTDAAGMPSALHGAVQEAARRTTERLHARWLEHRLHVLEGAVAEAAAALAAAEARRLREDRAHHDALQAASLDFDRRLSALAEEARLASRQADDFAGQVLRYRSLTTEVLARVARIRAGRPWQMALVTFFLRQKTGSSRALLRALRQVLDHDGRALPGEIEDPLAVVEDALRRISEDAERR
jgi:hypothetical protein